MHQVVISTADQFNGADLGIRQEWVPLFDKYGVDLVVCGHEHHYERSHPIRGQQPNADPDPDPGGDEHRRHRHDRGHRAHGDRRRRHVGAVQQALLQPAGLPGDHRGRRRPTRPPASGRRSTSRKTRRGRRSATPPTPTVSRRSRSIRATDAGGTTTITVTYYDVIGTQGELAPFETFTLERPRNDR